MKPRLIVAAFAFVWLLTIGAGFRYMLAYENTPGVAAASPVRWPAGAGIPKASDKHTLILFAHPQCPCTRASIGELALLMAHCQGKLTAYVLFVKPAGMPADWEKTDLWRSAAAIPGVHAVCDDKGLMARRFDASTSGQAMLYDSAGHLLFSGGITASRGHSGDNVGRSALESIITEGKAPLGRTLVFGCSLRSPGQLAASGRPSGKESK